MNEPDKNGETIALIRVRTYEKNSGDAVRRLGTIIQNIFVPNQEPAFA